MAVFKANDCHHPKIPLEFSNSPGVIPQGNVEDVVGRFLEAYDISIDGNGPVKIYCTGENRGIMQLDLSTAVSSSISYILAKEREYAPEGTLPQYDFYSLRHPKFAFIRSRDFNLKIDMDSRKRDRVDKKPYSGRLAFSSDWLSQGNRGLVEAVTNGLFQAFNISIGGKGPIEVWYIGGRGTSVLQVGLCTNDRSRFRAISRNENAPENIRNKYELYYSEYPRFAFARTQGFGFRFDLDPFP